MNSGKWKIIFFHGAGLGEPECDPNGGFHYFINIRFKQKRKTKDSWLINNINGNRLGNVLFTEHGAPTDSKNVSIVDLFYAIVATDTIAGGDIFGGIEGGNETWIFSDTGYTIFYAIITHGATKFSIIFNICQKEKEKIFFNGCVSVFDGIEWFFGITKAIFRGLFGVIAGVINGAFYDI